MLVSILLLVGSSSGAVLAEGGVTVRLAVQGEVVKDQKTGLVWEREPDYVFDVWDRSVARAQRKPLAGARLASAEHRNQTLVSLDQHDPSLPQGIRFRNIRSGIYWTAWPIPRRHRPPGNRFLFRQAVTDQKSGTGRLWCVLGRHTAIAGCCLDSVPFRFGAPASAHSYRVMRAGNPRIH